jgi:hypothetical protein
MDEHVVDRCRRLSRWVLLVLLVVGVSGMHTLGHADLSHGHGEAAAASMPMGQTPHPGMGGAVSSSAASSSGELPELDPGTVCSAVLTSLLLLFLGARRGRLLGRRRTPPAAVSDTGSAGRPPPGSLALNLTRVSVLRI